MVSFVRGSTADFLTKLAQAPALQQLCLLYCPAATLTCLMLACADDTVLLCRMPQGFTKEITMPREQWVGYIKDYDGGTLMEYVIHPKIPYADLVGMFRVGAAAVSWAQPTYVRYRLPVQLRPVTSCVHTTCRMTSTTCRMTSSTVWCLVLNMMFSSSSCCPR